MTKNTDKPTDLMGPIPIEEADALGLIDQSLLTEGGDDDSQD